MCTSDTVPSEGLSTSVSIFMASITARVSPLETLSPSLTFTLITVPGMGEPTWEGSASSAYFTLLR